jgi:hypothetical protein
LVVILYNIKNNSSHIAGIIAVAVILLFISHTVTLAFASPPATTSIQTPIQEDDGVVILEGTTVIDGTGALPKPNTTIVINGSRIAYLSSNNTSNNYDLNFSASKNVINLTGKYITPGLFDMHAHVANVRKNSYNQSESEYMLVCFWLMELPP